MIESNLSMMIYDKKSMIEKWDEKTNCGKSHHLHSENEIRTADFERNLITSGNNECFFVLL